MRIFVAGATGAMGRQLVPLLVANGYEVAGTTRSARKANDASRARRGAGRAGRPGCRGCRPSRFGSRTGGRRPSGDGASRHRQQPPEVRRGVRGDEPPPNRRDGQPARRCAGSPVWRGSWRRASRAGRMHVRAAPIKTEAEPLDPTPPGNAERTLAAIRHLEESVVGADELVGIALRYGGFYGPGTSLSRDGELADVFRKRAFPIVGSGAGIWSFIHIEDAARATLAAIERGEPRHLQRGRRRAGSGLGVAAVSRRSRWARNRRVTCRCGWAASQPASKWCR